MSDTDVDGDEDQMASGAQLLGLACEQVEVHHRMHPPCLSCSFARSLPLRPLERVRRSGANVGVGGGGAQRAAALGGSEAERRASRS